MQANKDPVAELLSSLYSERKVQVNIKGKDDLYLEDVYPLNRTNSNVINVDIDKRLFSPPERMPNIFGNQRQAQFPTKQQKAILSKLKKVPIYTVVNGYSEVVMASPRVTPPKNTLEWLYDKYYENFLWTEDRGAVSLGLFFINKEDAETYMQEICKRDPKGAETLGLYVKDVGLDTFYEFNRTSKPRMQAKLIADLKEIDSIINEYLKSDSLHFHPKQKYTINWFQGNPVYIMKIDEHADIINKKNFTLSKYNFDDSSGLNKKILLFTLDDAHRVWNLYRLKHPELKLPEEPNLEIYNLENYLLDLEKSDVELTQKTTFVPPYESYKHLKLLVGKSKLEKDISATEKFEQYIATKVKSLQRFYKGIVWLVTSDTLPSEDNAW